MVYHFVPHPTDPGCTSDLWCDSLFGYLRTDTLLNHKVSKVVLLMFQGGQGLGAEDFVAPHASWSMAGIGISLSGTFWCLFNRY